MGGYEIKLCPRLHGYCSSPISGIGTLGTKIMEGDRWGVSAEVLGTLRRGDVPAVISRAPTN